MTTVDTTTRAAGGSTRRTPRRRRSYSIENPRRSTLMTVLTGIVLLYSLVPLAWLVINATKTQASLFNSFGLWFSGDFALWDNIVQTVTYNDGIFVAMSTPLGPGVTARNGPTLRETSGMSGYRLAVEASSGQGWVSGPENHPGGVHHERARHRPMGHTAFGHPQGPSQ